MCGITGILAFNELGRMHMIHLANATKILAHRGPDFQDTYLEDRVGLGHRRLSIIDTSSLGHQPMKDPSGRYIIVYNGEIYNYQSLREQLEGQGVRFKSKSDTEVLLHLYIKHGADCLQLLNGFFSFAVYDSEKQQLFLARDRFGIKPLYYYLDEDKLLFASELNSLIAYNINKEIDLTSLGLYLQLNYIPAPRTMLNGVNKLMPAHFMVISKTQHEINSYYQIDYSPHSSLELSYDQQKEQFLALLDRSVQERLVCDVPLGAFLSGGVDSSAVVALASRQVPKLNTFSIGYRDHPYFDETPYAEAVAKKFNTNHTVFHLSNQDLYQHLQEVWDFLDEPFGDSSALPTYILSKNTQQSVTVALSGDGADELLGGYVKHLGLWRSMQGGWYSQMAQLISPLSGWLPQSRETSWGNKVRRLQRFAKSLNLSLPERYWFLASVAKETEALELIAGSLVDDLDRSGLQFEKHRYLQFLSKNSDMNDIFRTDMDLVLPNDMLTKVDRMSMARGLEVRVPFLDHRLVDFVFGLPQSSKIGGGIRKRILQDALKDILPAQVYRRPKKGFEVPLRSWMGQELKGIINDDLLHQGFIKEQQIFNPEMVERLKQKLWSRDYGDSPARIWSLLVFQYWWKKYFQ